MKKKMFALIAVLMILTGVVAGTVAYFTRSTETHNVITSGHIDIDLVETMLDGNTEVPYTNPVGGLMPGVTTSKIVRVHNVGPNPAWVRVKVEVEINDRKVDPMAEDSVLAIDLDTTKWEKNGSYYYYKEKLAPLTDKTIPLFTEVKLLEETGNDYQSADIKISVKAEGIQTQNNELAAGASITSVWPALAQILPYPLIGG